MPTVAEIIQIAIGSQPLAANDIARKGNRGGTIDLRLPRKIYMIRKNVERRYGQDPSDDTLTKTANYLLALCQPYGLAAQNKSGIAGTIAGITSGGELTPYQFEVTTTSFIAEGDLVKVFPSAWVGRDILFIRNAVPQGTVVLNQSNYYSWDSTTATLTLFGPPPPDGNNGAATETEQFQIFPV